MGQGLSQEVEEHAGHIIPRPVHSIRAAMLLMQEHGVAEAEAEAATMAEVADRGRVAEDITEVAEVAQAISVARVVSWRRVHLNRERLTHRRKLKC